MSQSTSEPLKPKKFADLPEGTVIRTLSGRYRKIWPRPNDRRGEPAYNVIQLEPTSADCIHPNLWRCLVGHGQDPEKVAAAYEARCLELSDLGLSPVYGTFRPDFERFIVEGDPVVI